MEKKRNPFHPCAVIALLTLLLLKNFFQPVAAETGTDDPQITAIKDGTAYKGAVAVGFFNADCGEVWSVITDYAGSSEFMPEIRKSEMLKRNGFVVHVKNVFRVVIFNVTVVFEMTEDPSGKKLSWRQLEGPFRWNIGDWTLDDCGEGRTKATYHIEFDLPLLPTWAKRSLIRNSIPKLYKAIRARLEKIRNQKPPKDEEKQ